MSLLEMAIYDENLRKWCNVVDWLGRIAFDRCHWSCEPVTTVAEDMRWEIPTLFKNPLSTPAARTDTVRGILIGRSRMTAKKKI